MRGNTRTMPRGKTLTGFREEEGLIEELEGKERRIELAEVLLEGASYVMWILLVHQNEI